MKEIHEDLIKRVSWYANWHNNPKYRHLHMATLILVSVLVGTYLYTDIQLYAQNDTTQYGLSVTQNSTSREDSIHALNDKAVKVFKLYSKADVSEKTAQVENLRKVLTERKSKILAEFKSNKGNIEKFFLPLELTVKFPKEVKSLLEEDIDVTGTLSAIFVDGIEEKDSKVEHSVVSSASKKEYKIYFGKNTPYALTGDKVSIKGKAFDTEVMVGDGGNTTNFQVTSSAIASDVIGTKTLLVIPVSFINNTSQPWTQANISDLTFNNPDSISPLVKEGSYDKVTLTGAVTPWYTINSSVGTTCDWALWASQAEQAAIDGGYTPSSYDHVMFYLNGVSPSICNWGGQAYIGGRQSWVNGIYAYRGTNAHELGHNFGSYHSGFLSCGSSQIAPIGTCSFSNYGEYNAKMGGSSVGIFQFNAITRSLFGWIPPSQVATVTTKGSYTIASDYSGDTITPKILKIAKLDSGENYYITYKQAVGFNASIGEGATRGASVYLKPNMYYFGNTTGGPSDTILLPVQVGSDYANAALWDGGSFTDSANGITITQLSHTADTVTISVDYPAPVCIRANQSVSINPTSALGTAGRTLSYSVTVKNNDSPACPIATYSLSGLSVPSDWAFVGGTVSASPGASASKSVTVTSNTTALDGSYVFNVIATDISDASKTAAVTGSYVVFTDQAGPTVTITSPQNGSNVATNSTLSASVSDVSGVSKVEFYIDGSLLKTFTASPYTMKWSTRKLARGTHIFLVKAYDALGNISQASVTFNK